MIKLEDSINRMTKYFSYKESNTFMGHQFKLRNKFEKKYVNSKTVTLEYKLALLKHDLKVFCTQFKYSKRKQQSKAINRSFSKYRKGVYRNFKGENCFGKVFGVKMLRLIKVLPG